VNTVYENPWFKVIEDEGFHYLKENGSDNGAVVLVIEKDSFIFVKVKRPAHGVELLEAPRGYGNSCENCHECAVRELFEETGYKVNVSDIEKLGVVRPNSAILASKVTVFLAKVAPEQKVSVPDDEVIDLVFIPFHELKKEIAKGNISDGFTLSALALYWSHNP